MSWLRVVHETTYRYAEQVRFGLHRLVLRPREGHDVRVEELTLQIEPESGVSILPALVEGKAVEHPPLYFEFHERGFGQAVRIGFWKGVRLGPKLPIELYDMKADGAEQHDVAAQNPEVVQRFEDYLKTARTDSSVWPIRENPPGKPAKPKQGQ